MDLARRSIYMKVAVYYSQKDVRIEDRPTPKIRDDEILVQMKACGICGSDLMEWYLQPRAPLVLGHEPTGVITEKGVSVKDFEAGDRVFVHHHVACMTCHYCINGDYTLCRQFHETNIEPGGFAEFFRVPSVNVKTDTLKIPPTMSDESGTLIEPVACCLRALKKAGFKKGDSVAVIGAGSTGIIHTALAKIFGASKIIVSDFLDFRLNTARKYGADIIVNPQMDSLLEITNAATNGIGADIVMVSAPNLAAYQAGLDICRKGGKLIIFAPTIPGKLLEVSPEKLFFSEVQIIPSYSCSHLETREALNIIKSGRFDAEGLITHRYTLDETPEAFQTAAQSANSLKVIVLSR